MGRVNAMNRLKEIQIGDKVIPFTQKWSIGPVGTIRDIKVSDDEWETAGMHSRR
jgi:hypothetical protein